MSLMNKTKIELIAMLSKAYTRIDALEARLQPSANNSANSKANLKPKITKQKRTSERYYVGRKDK